MTFASFEKLIYYSVIPHRRKGIRKGQAVANYLSLLYPLIYTRLLNTDKESDCYYNDKNIGKFMRFVKENWE